MISIPTVSIPTDTLVDARNLAMRLQKGGMFRLYVVQRQRLVIPVLLAFFVVLAASTAATVVFLSGPNAGLVLIAFLLAPFLFIGSLGVAAYLFFSWLEQRALRHALRHDVKGDPLPRVPWAWIAVFLVAPLLFLLLVWWKLAVPLLLLAAIAFSAYQRLDR